MSFMQKISVRRIPIYHANLTFLRKGKFLVAQNASFDARSAQTRYEILRPSLFLVHGASFMSRWPLLRGEGSAYPWLETAYVLSNLWLVLSYRISPITQ